MEELTWQQVLEGVGTDAYVEGMDTLPGGESKRGLMDRMRDIVLVRGALFPETQLEGGGLGGGDELVGDLDDDLLEGDPSATEKSIDELLASLGELDDDDDGTSWKFDDEDDKKQDEEVHDGVADEKMASIMVLISSSVTYGDRGLSLTPNRLSILFDTILKIKSSGEMILI